MVEDLGAVPPHVYAAVLEQALIVEAIDLRDLARLVAADERDAVGVARLEEEHERRALERIVAAVDVIAEEEIVGERRRPRDAKELKQIVELPVGVADDDDRRGRVAHVLLRQKHLCRELAQIDDLCLRQVLLPL